VSPALFSQSNWHFQRLHRSRINSRIRYGTFACRAVTHAGSSSSLTLMTSLHRRLTSLRGLERPLCALQIRTSPYRLEPAKKKVSAWMPKPGDEQDRIPPEEETVEKSRSLAILCPARCVRRARPRHITPNLREAWCWSKSECARRCRPMAISNDRNGLTSYSGYGIASQPPSECNFAAVRRCHCQNGVR
jgi:hypothetical protein